MPVLVIAEHNNQALRTATLNAVTAAARLGDDIHVLVAGSQCTKVSEQAGRIAGVTRVLAVDAVHYVWSRIAREPRRTHRESRRTIQPYCCACHHDGKERDAARGRAARFRTEGFIPREAHIGMSRMIIWDGRGLMAGAQSAELHADRRISRGWQVTRSRLR
jgi:hypothetical protein